MTNTIVDTSLQKTAKLAGFLYLIMVITGLFGLMYVPGKLFVQGNATATAENILASQSLFNINIVNSVISLLSFLFTSLVLYRLFEAVNKKQAAVMAILVLVQIPVGIRDIINQITALDLIRGEGFLSVLDKPQRDALAMMFLDLDSKEVIAIGIYWGLWLFPLGLLVFKSGFLPRFLGVWLFINGIAYIILSAAVMFFPQYRDIVTKILYPAMLGELVFMLWLLIMGIKPKTLGNKASISR